MSKGFRSGFIAVVGRPNVGKSTLMNKLIGEKISIISDKPQTTRNRIHCVLTKSDYQIVFVDTPGIQKPRNKLGEFMETAALGSLKDMDAVLFLVDGANGIGGGDRHIAGLLSKQDIPVVLAVNKMDKFDPKEIEDIVNELKESGGFEKTIFISAAENTNLDVLEKILVEYLPEGPKYYPDDMVTDQPERVIISEIIREKALHLLMEEVPHGIAVETTMVKERETRRLVDVSAVIFCEKSSHKGIIIGKGGSMLKEIGTAARKDIEGLLGIKVNLELWVKVKDDWRNDPKMLKNLGYHTHNI